MAFKDKQHTPNQGPFQPVGQVKHKIVRNKDSNNDTELPQKLWNLLKYFSVPLSLFHL